MIKVTTESFVAKAKSIYGDLYDYSKVEYKHNAQPITLICSIHGEFQVTPNKHLSQGAGCKECGKQRTIESKLKGLDIFLEEVKEVHGDLYDYSLSTFEKRKEKIIIICKKHGEFKQTVTNHLRGQGCPTCSSEKIGLSKRKDSDVYFKDCSYIFNNKYDYSETTFEGMERIIEPLCPEHGKFSVKAGKHYHRRQGCSICSDNQLKSKPVLDIRLILEENNIQYEFEKRFDDCRNILPLPFDFYLPEYNILIEYDGIQHFKPIEFWGGEEGLKEQQQNDNIKNQFCIDNNITLLRIPYTEDHIEVLHGFIQNLER